MLRYIKTNGQWIDTLEALKRGVTYMVIDGQVITMTDIGIEVIVGELEEERDSNG